MDDTGTGPRVGQGGLADHPLRSVPIEITISVGRARPMVRDLLALSENAVLPLDRRIDDPVELFIGGRLIARGELQELEGGEPGQLAVRLTEVAPLRGGLA
jgi:flagellar motor switch protein FliN